MASSPVNATVAALLKDKSKPVTEDNILEAAMYWEGCYICLTNVQISSILSGDRDSINLNENGNQYYAGPHLLSNLLRPRAYNKRRSNSLGGYSDNQSQRTLNKARRSAKIRVRAIHSAKGRVVFINLTSELVAPIATGKATRRRPKPCILPNVLNLIKERGGIDINQRQKLKANKCNDIALHVAHGVMSSHAAPTKGFTKLSAFRLPVCQIGPGHPLYPDPRAILAIQQHIGNVSRSLDTFAEDMNSYVGSVRTAVNHIIGVFESISKAIVKPTFNFAFHYQALRAAAEAFGRSAQNLRAFDKGIVYQCLDSVTALLCQLCGRVSGSIESNVLENSEHAEAAGATQKPIVVEGRIETADNCKVHGIKVGTPSLMDNAIITDFSATKESGTESDENVDPDSVVVSVEKAFSNIQIKDSTQKESTSPKSAASASSPKADQMVRPIKPSLTGEELVNLVSRIGLFGYVPAASRPSNSQDFTSQGSYDSHSGGSGGMAPRKPFVRGPISHGSVCHTFAAEPTISQTLSFERKLADYNKQVANSFHSGMSAFQQEQSAKTQYISRNEVPIRELPLVEMPLYADRVPTLEQQITAYNEDIASAFSEKMIAYRASAYSSRTNYTLKSDSASKTIESSSQPPRELYASRQKQLQPANGGRANKIGNRDNSGNNGSSNSHRNVNYRKGGANATSPSSSSYADSTNSYKSRNRREDKVDYTPLRGRYAPDGSFHVVPKVPTRGNGNYPIRHGQIPIDFRFDRNGVILPPREYPKHHARDGRQKKSNSARTFDKNLHKPVTNVAEGKLIDFDIEGEDGDKDSGGHVAQSAEPTVDEAHSHASNQGHLPDDGGYVTDQENGDVEDNESVYQDAVEYLESAHGEDTKQETEKSLNAGLHSRHLQINNLPTFTSNCNIPSKSKQKLSTERLQQPRHSAALKQINRVLEEIRSQSTEKQNVPRGHNLNRKHRADRNEKRDVPFSELDAKFAEASPSAATVSPSFVSANCRANNVQTVNASKIYTIPGHLNHSELSLKTRRMADDLGKADGTRVALPLVGGNKGGKDAINVLIQTSTAKGGSGQNDNHPQHDITKPVAIDNHAGVRNGSKKCRNCPRLNNHTTEECYHERRAFRSWAKQSERQVDNSSYLAGSIAGRSNNVGRTSAITTSDWRSSEPKTAASSTASNPESVNAMPAKKKKAAAGSCPNCNGLEHTLLECPKTKVCLRCGRPDHISAACPEPKRCNRCSGPHLAKDCHLPKTCYNCSSTGHTANQCTTFVPGATICRRCGSKEHPTGKCTKRTTPCYQCGKQGHIGEYCPSQKCNTCGEMGHLSNVCRKASEEAGSR